MNLPFTIFCTIIMAIAIWPFCKWVAKNPLTPTYVPMYTAHMSSTRTLSMYSEIDERIKIQAWALDLFKNGLLADLAKMDPNSMSDDEALMLSCAYEGWLVAGGRPLSQD